MQLRIYFSIVPQSCYSGGEQQIRLIYSDACNANSGGGQILNFLWKGEIRKGWRNQRQDLGIARACLLADSRSSGTDEKHNIRLSADVGRRVMHKIWTGWRSLNQPQLFHQKGTVVVKKSLLDRTCSSSLNGLSCPSKIPLHISSPLGGCSRAGSRVCVFRPFH